jgi:hypothetical protein
MADIIALSGTIGKILLSLSAFFLPLPSKLGIRQTPLEEIQKGLPNSNSNLIIIFMIFIFTLT